MTAQMELLYEIGSYQEEEEEEEGGDRNPFFSFVRSIISGPPSHEYIYSWESYLSRLHYCRNN